MPAPRFPVPAPPTPTWLTMILHDSGVLPSGAVTNLIMLPTGSFNSRTGYLQVRYTSDAPPSAPSRFVLKCNTPEAYSIAAGADEVRFYRLIAEFKDHPQVIPPCFAAEYDSSSGDSFLLLQDLSETHAPPITRLEQISIVNGVPLDIQQESVIDLLAVLHAYWWDHPRLVRGEFDVGYWSHDPERFNQYLAKRMAAWERLSAKDGRRIPAEIRRFYALLFERLPDYFTETLAPRFSAFRNLTLTHGDSYFCNFLCPKVPGSAPTYLMDWQSPSVDLAAYDLVNLLAAFWTRAQCQEKDRELALLHRYYRGLLSHGVQSFTWDDLLADYRSGLIFWVLMPVQDGGDGSAWTYWWPKMQCLVAAFEDWGC